MGIFDIIGPIMVGPSSSHTAGAARIGQTARAILGEPVKKARITLYGSFAKTGKGHGTDRALAAGLMGYAPDSGTIRDALRIAEEKNVDISFSLSEEDMGHPNVAKIEAWGVKGAHGVIIGRSLGGGRIMITNIDGYDVEITGEEYTLLTRHHDKPGVVAKVCEELAKEQINISTMRLFRKGKGSEAVMIIHTDQPVPPAVAEKVKESNDNITYVMALDII
ncbi:L-serine ammonia-lyase, iron-sulfur-dependent subunit beta [Dialister sp.]|uniref:L-serine ammonia-lyase, iron-sulfur-dependent subunit beta n=1 Tax=Dialister sp. TaxID=1955814 RepID=UPI0025F41A39|nr:L-serine ammonia-lyase, iron-sulfur-dependent subunit beta [Dialister sp.]